VRVKRIDYLRATVNGLREADKTCRRSRLSWISCVGVCRLTKVRNWVGRGLRSQARSGRSARSSRSPPA